MSHKRILIIDDESSIREVVHLCLSEISGYEVIEAESSQEGLLKAVVENPDAIVLDLSMPQMDGMEVLRRLKSSQVTQMIPVVILSAIANLMDPHQIAKQGAVEAISKPFNPLTLGDQIAAACHWI